MIIYLLDENFRTIQATDTFSSLQWNMKYYGVGDFEAHFPVGDDKSILKSLDKTEYVSVTGSTYTGIKQSSEYRGEDYCIKGRFLEDLLNKRVLSDKFSMEAQAGTIARELVRQYAVEPVDSRRAIRNLKIGKVDNWGESVYYSQRGKHIDECIGDLLYPCENTFNLRYDVRDNCIYFDILRGSDEGRTLFSSAYGNIKLGSETYSYSNNYKNFAYVAGMSVNGERIVVTVDLTDGEEDIKELWVDARDLQQETGQSEQAYKNILFTRGKEKLSKYQKKESAEFETGILDVKLGDKCEYINKTLGIRAEGRITEISEVFESGGFEKRIRIGEDQLGIMERVSLMV